MSAIVFGLCAIADAILGLYWVANVMIILALIVNFFETAARMAKKQ